MPSYLNDLMDRVVAMQKEAMETLTSGKFDAVDDWPYQQEAFPYMTNRPGAMTIVVNDPSIAEDVARYTRNILMRLVVGHYTQDYRGQNQYNILEYIVAIEDYFRNAPMLTTCGTTYGDYTAQPNYLLLEALITSDTGSVIFGNSGVGPLQIGVEFTLTTSYLRDFD